MTCECRHISAACRQPISVADIGPMCSRVAHPTVTLGRYRQPMSGRYRIEYRADVEQIAYINVCWVITNCCYVLLLKNDTFEETYSRGCGLCQRGFQRVLAIFLLKLCLKFIASEASEEFFQRNNSVLGINIHRSAAVGGGAPGCAPPRLDSLVT